MAVTLTFVSTANNLNAESHFSRCDFNGESTSGLVTECGRRVILCHFQNINPAFDDAITFGSGWSI